MTFRDYIRSWQETNGIEPRFQDTQDDMSRPAIWLCAAQGGKVCDHGDNDGACEFCCRYGG